jgi:mono/diheme cytochrome c family protein
MDDRMPRWAIPALAVVTALAILPFAFAAKSRASKTSQPRVQMVPDMDQQPRYGAQDAHPLFEDGRAMRPPVAGTVARGELREDDRYYRGKVGDDWVKEFPVELTMDLLERGRERYGIFCAACHGLGIGGLEEGADVRKHGIVDERALELEQPKWITPTSFHSQQVRERSVGHLYNTITNGIRSMPAYASQIPPEDRWAIVAYLRALQRSQNAKIEDVPADFRESLR